MAKAYAGIAGVCFVLCVIFVTVTVGVVSWRTIFGEHGQTSAAQANATNAATEDGQADSDPVPFRPPAVRPNLNAKQNPGKQVPHLGEPKDSKFYVMVADEDMRAAQEIAEEAARRLTTPNTAKKYPPQARVDFSKFTDDEKNKAWWIIESYADRHEGESISYVLRINQAAIVASQFGVSVLEIFNLFREGSTAEWRTGEPPPEEEDEK